MTTIQTTVVSVPSEKPIRTLIVRPQDNNQRWPTVVAWSDIFQLTEAHLRLVRRIAGHGFVVVAPELYSRIEPSGVVLDFERDRQRALDDSAKMQLAWIDEERKVLLDWLSQQDYVDPTRLFAAGWCFGGHVAFRAALDTRIRAACCFYPTGLHSNTLGAAQGSANTLEQIRATKAAMFLAWGRKDPHIPVAGRSAIHRALEAADLRYEVHHYDAEHAFMRDEGRRYNPQAADHALAAAIAFLQNECRSE